MNKKLLKAHGKVVSHNGYRYRIIAHELGGTVLACADRFDGRETHNLVRGRSPLVMALRNKIEQGLVS